MPKEIITILEQLRKSSETGKNFANSPYDVTRYMEMLALIEKLYDSISEFDIKLIDPVDRTGYITPKVGINGIVEREDGKVLLEQRIDDKCWGIPGGWAEPGLTAEENVIKELKEETGFNVEAEKMVGVVSRKPTNEYPFTSYHILFKCNILSGDLTKSYESESVDWKDPDQLTNWHYDHYDWIKYYRKMIQMNH